MIQVFGRKKCRETQAAERFFKDRRVLYQSIDIDLKAPSPGETDAMARALGGHDCLIDHEGKAWKDKGGAWLDADARSLLLADVSLYRTPLVRLGKLAVVGKNEAAWLDLISVVKELK